MEKKWHYNNGYAVHTWRKDGKSHAITMHKLLMNTPKGMETDHINTNKLDNRRSNLRIVTSAQNKWNVGKRTSNTSGHKGVIYNKHHKKWYTRIRVDGRRVELGYYSDLQDAIEAYKRAEEVYHGEYASYRRIIA